MENLEEKMLPSGAILRISLAPFADAKSLYQAVLEELKHVSLSANRDLDLDLMKDLFCAGFSSKAVDSALTKCLGRCLYNGKRIGEDTFEESSAREDYVTVCWEVAYANLRPFMKNLASRLKGASSALIGSLEQKSPPAQKTS